MLTRLRSTNPYLLEHFVANLWDRLGWQTEVQPKSEDSGIDIIAERKDEPIDLKAAIQVKRFDENNKIGPGRIRNYAALKQQESDLDAVVIVTTSTFTEGAEELASSINVKLVDSEDLFGLISKHDLFELVDHFTPTLWQMGEKGDKERLELTNEEVEQELEGRQEMRSPGVIHCGGCKWTTNIVDSPQRLTAYAFEGGDGVWRISRWFCETCSITELEAQSKGDEAIVEATIVRDRDFPHAEIKDVMVLDRSKWGEGGFELDP